MVFFEWNDEKYSVGVPEMDRQHKYLVKLLNQLYEAMYAGQGREPLKQILNALLRYAENHFRDEERLMQKYGYPDFEAHRQTHIKMAAKVKLLHEEFEEKKLVAPIQLSNFLKNWLAKHIMVTDKYYGEFIKGKGTKAAKFRKG